MADERLRRLEREAATGGPAERARLEAARSRSETAEEGDRRRRIEQIRAGMLRDSGEGLKSYLFTGDVWIEVSTTRKPLDEGYEETCALRFRDHALALTKRVSAGGETQRTLFFDEVGVFWSHTMSGEPEPATYTNVEGARWANRMLRDLGLPLGREVFERFVTHILDLSPHLYSKVYHNLPDDLAPLKDPQSTTPTQSTTPSADSTEPRSGAYDLPWGYESWTREEQEQYEEWYQEAIDRL